MPAKPGVSEVRVTMLPAELVIKRLVKATVDAALTVTVLGAPILMVENVVVAEALKLNAPVPPPTTVTAPYTLLPPPLKFLDTEPVSEKIMVEDEALNVEFVTVPIFQIFPVVPVIVIMLVPSVRALVLVLLEPNEPHEQAWLFVLSVPFERVTAELEEKVSCKVYVPPKQLKVTLPFIARPPDVIVWLPLPLKVVTLFH